VKAHWLSDAGELGGVIPAGVLRDNGVVHQSLDTDPAVHQGQLDMLGRERGYVQQDIVELRPDTPNLGQICAKLIDEHYHDDDEVRFVPEGAGVFDIRDDRDRWMRVEVRAGDLIVVPARRHHRFFLTDANTLRCLRLFKDESGWVPHYRT